MLTRLAVRNFKLFADVEIELAERVVFVGPNNSGKTSALQTLALWKAGVRRWVEKRGAGEVPRERAGVTINRRDLIAMPVPSANLLWRDRHVREGERHNGKPRTRNVLSAIDEIARALAALGRPDPWSHDIKASDDFLGPVFAKFYERLRLPNLSRKADYHVLAPFTPVEALDPEIMEKLDAILASAKKARPAGSS